jgi:hypothetical protein
LTRTLQRIVAAVDHGGFELKEQLVKTFLAAQFDGTERQLRHPAKVVGLGKQAITRKS